MGADTFDFDARYSVDGWGAGIAFYSIGYVMVRDEDYDWTGLEEPDTDRVRMIMVGDDRVFEIEVCETTPIAEDDYCSECGQIGCSADGRSSEPMEPVSSY